MNRAFLKKKIYFSHTIVDLSTNYTQYVYNFGRIKKWERLLWITFYVLYFVVLYFNLYLYIGLVKITIFQAFFGYFYFMEIGFIYLTERFLSFIIVTIFFNTFA